MVDVGWDITTYSFLFQYGHVYIIIISLRYHFVNPTVRRRKPLKSQEKKRITQNLKNDEDDGIPNADCASERPAIYMSFPSDNRAC